MTTGRRLNYHVYERGGAYLVFSDAGVRRMNKLARSRYKPVALGFRTRAEAVRHMDRLRAAGEQPEPPRHPEAADTRGKQT